MPRRTLGPTVQKRALRLFEALVSFAQDIANQGNPDIKFRWIEKTSTYPKLVIETQTRYLIQLTKNDNYPGSLKKAQVVEALQRMEDFLGILEDNRVKKKGTEERHFTLTLYCQDLATNREVFNQQWDNKRPEKSKQQEQATATTPKTCQALRPKPGVPFQAPPLPRYFIQRPEVSQSLKQSLLSEQTAKTGTLVVSAIYGLGGIGKSTLAVAIARDPEVQSHFPDGVLWATLGQQPDLLSFLSSWIQALGDHDYKPTNTNAASRHLQTLLFDKATLLVVDDAWNPDHVEAFRIGGAKCRVLVTTREAQIVGVTPYNLDVMSPSQALALLEDYGGSKLKGSDREQAQALATTVGYLPLALELAAAQIADGISWNELLTDLQTEIALLETLDLPGAQEVDEKRRKHYSLVASFNLSLRRLPSEKFQQFAWLGVLPEDVSITPALGTTLWDLSPREARRTLQYFKSKALLLSGKSTNESPTYQLHDLVHDMARRLLTAQAATGGEGSLPGLGLTWPQAHGQLLERYRQKTENGLWHTLPDDGYSHTYLTWHLEKAGWVEEVHQLLQEETEAGRNGWYQTCERLGQLGGFVKDVAKAWQLAEEAFSSSPTRSISLQCRYALMVSSLNSLVGNIPGELMAALVEKKIWTPVQAFAYVQQIQDPFSRGEALGELAPHLPERLLPEALEAARAITDERAGAYALIRLVPYLPESLLSEALEGVRAITDEYRRAYALSFLAPHWPEILPQALEAAQALTDNRYRADALIQLAPHWPGILPQALEVAQALTDNRYRADALIQLAPHWPEILPQALEAAQALTDEYHRTDALIRLAPQLPEILPQALEATRVITNQSSQTDALIRLAPQLPEILPQALEAAQAITDEYRRAIVLSKLAPHLAENLLSEALEAAQAITDNRYRADALSKLAPHWPEILPQALEAAQAITDEYHRADALSKLASHWPRILPQALEATRVITDNRDRAYALSKLAPHWPEILPQALEAARVITDNRDRADALSKLAPHWPEILPQALEAARVINDNRDRAYALSKLAPYWPEILPQALEAAQAITDERDRADALGGLAPHFPESLLREALEVARAITGERDRADALSGLAPHLTEILLPEALEVARTITDEWHRADALSKIAPHLPEILAEALEAIRALSNDSLRASVLSGLAPHFPESLLPEALEATDEWHRADALSKLAPHLPESLLPEALEAARALTKEYDRAYALNGLAPHLPESLLPEVLESARAIQSEYYRASVFSGLIENPNLSLHDVLLWQEFLHTLACPGREYFLAVLVNLSPTIISLGGKEALASIFEAIQDVSRWWP